MESETEQAQQKPFLRLEGLSSNSHFNEQEQYQAPVEVSEGARGLSDEQEIQQPAPVQAIDDTPGAQVLGGTSL